MARIALRRRGVALLSAAALALPLIALAAASQAAAEVPATAATYTYDFGSAASLSTYDPVSTVPAGGLGVLGQYGLTGSYTVRPEADSPYAGSRLFTVTHMHLAGQGGGPVFDLPAGTTGQLVCFSTGCEPSVRLEATG